MVLLFVLLDVGTHVLWFIRWMSKKPAFHWRLCQFLIVGFLLKEAWEDSRRYHVLHRKCSVKRLAVSQAIQYGLRIHS